MINSILFENPYTVHNSCELRQLQECGYVKMKIKLPCQQTLNLPHLDAYPITNVWGLVELEENMYYKEIPWQLLQLFLQCFDIQILFLWHSPHDCHIGHLVSLSTHDVTGIEWVLVKQRASEQHNGKIVIW